MCGIHFNLVRKSQELFVQTVVEQASHLFGGKTLGANQVGTADLTNEKCVAGKEPGWLNGSGGAHGENRDALWRVSGRLDDREKYVTYSKFVTVFDPDVGERSTSLFAENDFGIGSIGQFAVSADKVCVKVCLDYILDYQTICLQPGVLSFVDDSHATMAELFNDLAMGHR